MIESEHDNLTPAKGRACPARTSEILATRARRHVRAASPRALTRDRSAIRGLSWLPHHRSPHAPAPVAAAGPRRPARPARPVDHRRARRQVLRLRHRRRPADLGLRRRLDVAARGHRDAGGAGAGAGRDRARRQQHLGAGRHPHRRQVLPLLLGAGHAAEVGHRPAGRQDARSRLARLQVGGRGSGGLVRRRRGQQRDRSRRLSRSRRRQRCGSPTAPTSATSAWSSWIRRPASGSIRSAQPVNIAINSEASIMIFRDGWYYLLVTHGSCCAGANSSYNIRMGRARKVTGPFLDNMGIDMLQGGGKLFARLERPPHRSRPLRPARSRRRRAEVLAATTRPISIAAASACSTSGRCSGATAGRWPATTSRPAPTRSSRRARARRSSWRCRACRSAGSRPRRSRRPGGGPRRGAAAATPPPPPDPGAGSPPQVGSATGRPGRSTSAWRPTWCRRSRSGRSRRSPNAGGYPGSPYFKITIAGTDRALAATADARTDRRCRPSPARPNSCGASTSSPTAPIADAEGRAGRRRAAGAVGRRQQHADARQVPARQRSAALAHQDAMSAAMNSRVEVPCRMRRDRSRAGLASVRRARAAGGQQPAPAGARASARAVARAPGVAQRSRRTPTASSSAGSCSSRFACRASSPTARSGRAVEDGRLPGPARRRPARRRQVTVGDDRPRLARRRHDRLQRQPVSLRLRAEQADVERAVLGRHRRQRAARDDAACAWPSARTPRRSGGSTARKSSALYNDRQTVIDDGVSKRLTLKQGPQRRFGPPSSTPAAPRTSARGSSTPNDRPITAVTVELPTSRK